MLKVSPPQRSGRWKYGLGALALLGAIAYFNSCPTKKTASPPPPPKPDITAPTDDAGPKRITKQELLKRKQILSDLRRFRELATETEEVETDESQIKTLEQLFDELNDDPAPITDFSDMKLMLSRENVCPDNEEFNGQAAVYNGNKLLGYMDIGTDQCDLKTRPVTNLLSGIIDGEENLIGFRQRTTHSEGKFFWARSGTSFKTSQEMIFDNENPEGENERGIYVPENPLPIGDLNEKTSEFKNNDGETIGYLDKDLVFAPLYPRPRCTEEESLGDPHGFLQFYSYNEYLAFEAAIIKQNIW
jgi:hypothetical protein